MTFAEILAAHPATVEVFKRLGLHCAECAIARLETLEDCALLHDIDADALAAELNEFIDGHEVK
jgi:hybrid cluster-associated redox disulfide protein